MILSDKIAVAAFIIAGLSFAFSWYSFYRTDKLSKTAFNRNYRPYVTAANFAYIDKNDGKIYNDMNTLIIRILNAPALITSKKLSFHTSENNNDILLYEHPVFSQELVYPLDNSQNTIYTDTNKVSQKLATEILPKKLIRKARIEYQWLSDSALKYYFESEWEYNITNNYWDIVMQNAS